MAFMSAGHTVMTSAKSLSVFECGRIVEPQKQVLAQCAIAAEVGCSKTVILHFLKDPEYLWDKKSQVIDPKKIRGTCRMVQESDVILLEEVLHQAVVVNCSIVLLKNPVITAQTRALSQEGCPLQHVHIASCRLTPLHNLKIHYPIEGKSTPDHDGASSTVPRRKHLQWDLLVIPVTLEAIRTIQVKIFSSENKTFFHLSRPDQLT